MNKPPPLALITGGCKRVGAVISAHFAKAGYNLALHGHSDANPDKKLQTVLDETDVSWHGFMADLSQEPSALIDDVCHRFGRTPDVLINNASLFEYDDVDTQTSETLNQHMAVNFCSPLLLTKAVIDRHDNQPSIIQIIDQRVRNPNVDQISYTLSKQALAESIRTQAIAYKKRARINGIAPGFSLAPNEFSETHIQRIADSMPLGANSDADDIAQAALYLTNAKSVTGQLLYVDGGAHLKSFDKDFQFM